MVVRVRLGVLSVLMVAPVRMLCLSRRGVVLVTWAILCVLRLSVRLLFVRST